MDLNNLVAGVTVPGWALAAGAVVLLVLLLLAFRPRGSGIGTLANVALVAVVAGAAYFGLKLFNDHERAAELRVLEARATALVNQAHQPGSVLACLNATGAIEEACERAVFAEPQGLASAVALTADRVAFLIEVQRVSERQPAFAERFAPIRTSIEADPYGLVAYVLARDHTCNAEQCAPFRALRDPAKIKANLAAKKYDGLLARYTEIWNAAKAKIDFSTVALVPPLHTIGGDVSETQLPLATTAVPLPAPNGEAAPAILPQTAPNPQAAPDPEVRRGKKKGATNPAGATPPAARRRVPEPVGGLPRVTARGANPPADDADDEPAAAPAPPPRSQSPFPQIFGR
jgi:hypothetical protein